MIDIPFKVGDCIFAEGVIGIVEEMEVQMVLTVKTPPEGQLTALAMPIHELKNIQKIELTEEITD